MDDFEKIQALMHHIRNVQENAVLLGTRLIKAGEADLGRNLIANGFIHDYSKFRGIEWDELWRENDDKNSLALAIKQHNSTNAHHPEYWGTIQLMPRLYIAEMICDWKARSNEFGGSLEDWIKGEACKRFNFGPSDKVYEEIMTFFGMLCDKPFKKVRPEAAGT